VTDGGTGRTCEKRRKKLSNTLCECTPGSPFEPGGISQERPYPFRENNSRDQLTGKGLNVSTQKRSSIEQGNGPNLTPPRKKRSEIPQEPPHPEKGPTKRKKERPRRKTPKNSKNSNLFKMPPPWALGRFQNQSSRQAAVDSHRNALQRSQGNQTKVVLPSLSAEEKSEDDRKAG